MANTTEVLSGDEYLDFLKGYDGLDKYILFALWLTDWSLEDIASELKVTRQTIYNTIKRNQDIYDRFVKPRRNEI